MSTKSNPNITPAIPAPAGQRSNLVDPPSKDPIFIACCVLIIVLSTPWVAVRLYTRFKIKPKLWWDDCEASKHSFVKDIRSLTTGPSNMLHRLGLHGRSVRPEHLHPPMGRGQLIGNCSKLYDHPSLLPSTSNLEPDSFHVSQHFHDTQIIARVGMCCTKISFLLFYQRLLVPVGTRWTAIWWSIWLVFWYNVLYAIALIITITTACVGKAAIVAKGGQCVNEYAVLICASVINVSSDIFILVIPIVGIWGLQMPKAKKRRLSAVFVVGGLAVLSSVARLGYQIANAGNKNQSIAIMIVSMLNLAEQFIGVIVSCMPILPAFYRHIRHSRSSGSSSSGKNKGKDLTANIMGFQPRHLQSQVKISSGGASSKRSKSSKVKDPFPVYSTTDENITTRGYEELGELESGPKVGISMGE
ncbi:MAG: hypothetical protein Q9170_004722 [Blastenia crenularia]